MLGNSFNLENFKRHFQQTIPKPSRMPDKTENVDKLWTLYALMPYTQFYDGIMMGEGQTKNKPASKLFIWAREVNPHENAVVFPLTCRTCVYLTRSQAWQETDKPNDPV